MLYPSLNKITQTKESITSFKGYNNNPRIAEGEFRSTYNMSALGYPVMSPRKQRELVLTNNASVTGMIAKDDVYYTKGDKLYRIVNGQATAVDGVKISGDTRDKDKKLISMGAYLIVLPDNVYLNTADDTDCGDIFPVTRMQDIARFNIRIYMKGENDTYTLLGGNLVIGTNVPETSETLVTDNKKYFLDISENPCVLYDINNSSSSSAWIEKEYVIGLQLIHQTGGSSVIHGVKNGAYFSMYDASGVFAPMHDKRMKVVGCLESDEDNYTYVILDSKLYMNVQTEVKYIDYVNFQKVYTDSIRMTNNSSDGVGRLTVYDETGSAWSRAYCVYQTSALRVEGMPRLDFITESGNRLWGCRYGEDNAGAFVNEIYASALGSFKEWETFDGISTDSYTVSVGTDGAFTGAVTYGGSPIFFKENCYHRIYGSMPSEYQVVTESVNGVKRGCDKTVCNVNGILIYQSPNGFMTYDGSAPSSIGYALRGDTITGICSASANGVYYVCGERDGTYYIYTYDTVSTLWMREDIEHWIHAVSYKNNVLFADANSYAIEKAVGDNWHGISWYAETGEIGITEDNSRYLVGINVCAKLTPESVMNVSVMYDEDDDWHRVRSVVAVGRKNFNIQIRVRRCQHIRIRFDGIGYAEVYAMHLISERGGAV